MRKRIRVAAGERVTVAFASPEGRLVEVNCGWPEVRGAGEAWMMLSNSLQWANKFGAQRKAAHPSPMGRRQWSAQRCAEQQKVRKFEDHLDA